MAKKSVGNGVASSLRLDKSGHRPDATRQKPSSLLDTRVVYCGDNLEQLAKLPDSCSSALRTPHSTFALTGSFYYHWN
jgi:hypothetical protein